MTELGLTVRSSDPYDRSRATGASGALRAFNEAGVLDAADVHVALRLAKLATDQTGTAVEAHALLGAAFAVRAVRLGSICLDPRTISETPVEDGVELPWPDPESWIATLANSPLVAAQILRLDDDLLYLDRYWREELSVCEDLLARLAREAPEIDEPLLETGLQRIFPATGFEEQCAAARSAVKRWTTIITGGPGTGKTTTVAGVLALIAEQHEHATGERPRIALAAPTGKAAARLQAAAREAVASFDPEDKARLGTIRAVTVHSLLGSRMPRTSVRFQHDRHHRLPYDVVVIDEGSMLSLSMAARLLEALRPSTRLILVGDADQLSSVDAGAVLSDLVRGLEEHAQAPVTRLLTTHRYGGGIGALAAALRGPGPDADPGEVADAVLHVLGSGTPDVVWVKPDDEEAMAWFRADVHERAAVLLTAARRGSAAEALTALEDHRLLCAHREGPYGVTGWNREIERMLADGGEKYVYQEWYAGRPVLVSANDRLLGLNNGDMGITVFGENGRLQVALPTEDGERLLPTTRMPVVQTVFAMTIHKSQGSQARTVSVILPPPESPLLTRELFYTAVTRAQETVRVVGSEEAVRAAVEREVIRASGLRRRLAESATPEGPHGSAPGVA